MDQAKVEDLFGDAGDISSEGDAESNKSKSERGSDAEENDARNDGNDSEKEEREKRDSSVERGPSNQDSDSDHSRRSGRSRRSEARSVNENQSDQEPPEVEPEAEPIPETRIDVEIPKIITDLGRDTHFVKLPNFLSVEMRPFDPNTYEDEIDEEETLDEEGRARLKLKVENTIRWRDYMDDEGNMKKDSNARLIRWSDGSLSLHLGSEIFDVYKQPLQGDHNHLFIRQGTGLQGQAVFRTKLSFRPHSTESFTHRKMTLSLADRSTKTQGIKILSQVGANPDQDRYEMLKKDKEKLRYTARPTKPTRKRDNATARSALNASTSGSGGAFNEEGSDDEGAISLNAIKNKYKQNSGPAKGKGNIYSSDDDEGSDLEPSRVRRGPKAPVVRESDSGSD